MTRPAVRVERASNTLQDRSPFAVGLLLRRAHDRAAGALVAALRPQGLELRHFAVMITLAGRAPLSQRELAETSGMDKATMARVVDDLERLGYATRTAPGTDRRVRNIELTDAGRTAFEAVHEPAQDISDQLMATLRPGEAEVLLDILRRFIEPDAG